MAPMEATDPLVEAEAGSGSATVLATIPFAEWFPRLAEIPGTQVLFVVFLAILGAVIARYLVRLLGRPVARRFSRQSVAQTVIRGIRVGTIVSAVLFGLWAVGVRFTDVLLIGTVLSAVIGIILAPLIGNFINGVFILADQPFEIGDMIELEDGTQGFVDDITIRYTKIFTLDNTFLVIPNGNMRDRDVTNYSAEDERSRQTLDLLVTYECDVDAGRRIMERAARDCDAVIDGGPDIRVGIARYNASPDCRIEDFGDDGILLRLRYWVKKPYKLGKVRSEINTRIRELAADVDVEMAYPHRHLIFDDTSGVAQVGMGVADDAPTSVPGNPPISKAPSGSPTSTVEARGSSSDAGSNADSGAGGDPTAANSNADSGAGGDTPSAGETAGDRPPSSSDRR